MHCETPACQHAPNPRAISVIKAKTDLAECLDSGDRQVIQCRSSKSPEPHTSITQSLNAYSSMLLQVQALKPRCLLKKVILLNLSFVC